MPGVRVLGDPDNPDSLVRCDLAPLYRRAADLVRHGRAQSTDEVVKAVLGSASHVDHQQGCYFISIQEWRRLRQEWTGGEVLSHRTPWRKRLKRSVPWLVRGMAVVSVWWLVGWMLALVLAAVLFRRTTTRVLYIVSGGSVVVKAPDRPGDWAARSIQLLTLNRVSTCSACKTRAAMMNEAGWRGLAGLLWGWARGAVLRRINRIRRVDA